VTKPITAENSGYSYNQLIVNVLNTPILQRMDSSDYFPSMHIRTKCHISARPYSTYEYNKNDENKDSNNSEKYAKKAKNVSLCAHVESFINGRGYKWGLDSEAITHLKDI
jgi:hypothetical protein